MKNINKVESSCELLQMTVTIACFFTVCSQILKYYTVLRALMFGAWILVLIGLLIRSKMKIYFARYIKFFGIIYIVYVVFICLLSIFTTSSSWLGNDFVSTMGISLVMYIIGFNLINIFSISEIDIMGQGAAMGAILLAVYLNANYMPSYAQWLAGDSYLYASKNSAGQIFAVCAIWLLVSPTKKKGLAKVIRSAMIVFFLFECAIYQCRTAILGVILAICIYILCGNKKKYKTAIIVMIITAIVIFIVATENPLKTFLIHAMRLDNKWSMQSSSHFLSNRDMYYQNAWAVFCESPIIGVGFYRVDNLYLIALAQGGVIGGFLVLSVWISKIIKTKHYIPQIETNRYALLIVCLTAFYFVESLAESLPPFGPGTCSFLFWLLSGYIDNTSEKT